MIEFFVASHFTNKTSKLKNKENTKIKEMFNNDDNVTQFLTKQSINVDALNFVMGVVALVISIFAAKLAFECNSKTSVVSQVVSVLFGFFFSGFYLSYYFIWHKILGNKC